jgi:hypothetical protein
VIVEINLWYVWIGVLVYLCIGYAYASLYKHECENNIEEKYESGAYYIALFLWLFVLIFDFFEKRRS